jgi:hypothetical protein
VAALLPEPALTQGEWVPVSMAMRIGGCSEAKGRKEKARAKEGSTKRGQGHYKGRSPKASARLAPKSGRDGGEEIPAGQWIT